MSAALILDIMIVCLGAWHKHGGLQGCKGSTCATPQLEHMHIMPLAKGWVPQEVLQQHKRALPYYKSNIAEMLSALVVWLSLSCRQRCWKSQSCWQRGTCGQNQCRALKAALTHDFAVW